MVQLPREIAVECDWLDNGLVIPSEVSEATEQFRSDSDPIGRFLAACTRQAPNARVQATALHAVYGAWAKVNGEAARSLNSLGRELRSRGMPEKKSSAQWWTDIELTRGVDDFVDGLGDPLAMPEEADDG